LAVRPATGTSISIGKWDYRENNRRLMEADPVAPMFDEPETLRERIAPQYCMRSAGTATQYWIEKKLAKAN